MIPELRNWHGKVLICYTCVLATTFTLLLLIELMIDDLGMFCTVAGYCLYFSTLSCFSFLNVMGYDVWSSLTGNQNRRNFHDKKKFLRYLSYGLGLPGLFLTAALSMKFLEVDYLDPKIGEMQCILESHSSSAWIYLYSPVIAVLITNTYFFLSTAFHINVVQKKTALKESEVHNKKARANYLMFIRLSLLMGLTWTLEIVGQFTDCEILQLSDFLNCLQGVMIFFLFVWSGKTKTVLKDRRVSSPDFSNNFLIVFFSRLTTIRRSKKSINSVSTIVI